MASSLAKTANGNKNTITEGGGVGKRIEPLKLLCISLC